jgi:hypothetical protein
MALLMARKRWVSALALLALALAAGCGGDDGKKSAEEIKAQDDVVADAAADLNVPSDATSDGETPEELVAPGDVAPDQPGEEELIDEEEIVENLDPGDVKRIKGKVVDNLGNPVADLFVQPCTYTEESELCHKATTDANGDFVVTFTPAKKNLIGIHVRFVTDLYTPSACYWDLADIELVDNEIVFADPFVIYPFNGVAATVEVGVDEPVAVSAEGVTFTVQPEEWFPGIFEPVTIRGRAFPLDEYVPCFLDEAALPDALYSFTPDWISFAKTGGIDVTFANTAGLEPGAKVSLFVLGSLDTQIRPLDGDPIWLHTGEWYEYGTGTVNEDGTLVVADPGSGLPGLGWVGWKAQ